MPATATRRPPKPYRMAVRDLAPVAECAGLLIESGSKDFRVDREKGIIYGAKVYGLHSPNSHGRAGVTDGTDYPPELHRSSLSIFNGLPIYANHPDRVQDSGKVRKVEDAVGVLENCRVEPDGTYGDLRLNTAKETARAMLEDADKRIGNFALSINALPAKENVTNGRLVIREFAYANSVDVVTKGGTNKTLWESQRERIVTKTFKAILEAWAARKSEPRQKLARMILEDDSAAADATADTAEGADPEAELWDGFMSAIVAIINGDGTADEKAKKVGKYLKAHEKLTAEPEPKGDKTDYEEDDTGGGAKKDTPDKDTDDKPDAVTKEQRENRELRSKVALLEAGVKEPPASLVKALGLLESEADRKALIDAYKPAGTPGTSKVKSGAPAPRAVTEAKAPATAEDLAKLIRE